MPIAINGSGTVTGISVGGLPDGIVDADMLASNAVTAGKLASGVGGKILQVVSTTKTDTFSATANQTVDITGLSVSITPSSTSSKILISYSITAGITEGGFAGGILLLRDSTQIYLGDAASNRARISNFISISNTGGGTDYNMVNASGEHLDSPSTTSAITYKLQAKTMGSGAFYIGRSKSDSDQNYIPRTPSSITLLEVAA